MGFVARVAKENIYQGELSTWPLISQLATSGLAIMRISNRGWICGVVEKWVFNYVASWKFVPWMIVSYSLRFLQRVLTMLRT